MNNNRQANALLGLQGLNAAASATMSAPPTVVAEASMSLEEFSRSVKSSNDGNNESRLVSHGNHALANTLDKLSESVEMDAPNGSFWGEGDNMTINISLGTGRVTVGSQQ